MKKRLQNLLNRISSFWIWFKKASWKKRILVIVVILILFFILKGIFLPSQKQKYTFDTVKSGNITQLVTENGNVIASNETDIFSPTTGVLDQIYVKNGDIVSSGAKLFTVRSTATEQEKAVAYANYLQAQSANNAANASLYTLQSTMFSDWETFTNLAKNSTYQNGDGSPNVVNRTAPEFTTVQDNWLGAEVAYKNQQAVIAQTQAGLTSASLANQATQNATVTAPTTGTVGNIVGLTGAKVVAQVSSSTISSTSSNGQTSGVVTPVMVIGNTNGYAIQTTVSEVDINKVSIGEKVDIIFSAIPNKTYTGHVIQADSFGTNTGGIVTYNIFLAIDNPDNNIKSNMSANLTITTAAHNNVLTVANSAIIPYQSGKAVQVLDNKGKVQYIPVIVGLRGFTRSEILKGVSEGTKVILGNTQLTTNASSAGN